MLLVVLNFSPLDHSHVSSLFSLSIFNKNPYAWNDRYSKHLLSKKNRYNDVPHSGYLELCAHELLSSIISLHIHIINSIQFITEHQTSLLHIHIINSIQFITEHQISLLQGLCSIFKAGFRNQTFKFHSCQLPPQIK